MQVTLDKDQVVGAYRRIAPIYDLWSCLTESKSHDLCLELAAIDNGERILEVAVGTGRLFARVVGQNPDGTNVGVDLSPAMLAKARHRLRASGARNVELRKGDAYELADDAAAFDLLLCTYMFDLLPERDFHIVLAEFSRVLSPGGRLVLVNMTRGGGWTDGLWRGLYRLRPALLGGCQQGGPAGEPSRLAEDPRLV